MSFQDEEGNTPLHLAVRERRRNFVHLLLKERANVNILNAEASSPLHMAAICCKTEQSILTDLIQSGAKLNQTNPFGQTPLLIACDRTHDRLVRLLLEFGANPNCRDISGQTPLHYCNRLDYVTVQLLLDAGAPLNTPDTAKRRPLHILAGDRLTDSWRASAIAELLLQFKAKIDVRDGYRRTPLMVAMYEGNLVLAKLFIRAGCCVQANIADALGNTPLALALRSFSGDFELIKMLLDSGANTEAWMHQLMDNCDDRYVGSILTYMRSKPKILPLTSLCRIQIRKMLPGRLLDVIPNMTVLPAAVKSFLLFK